MAMSYANYDHRPHKKRRFFVEEPEDGSSTPVEFPLRGAAVSDPATTRDDSQDNNIQEANLSSSADGDVFDADLFASVVGGDVSLQVRTKLQEVCGSNIERAVNMYFDGSYKSLLETSATSRPIELASFVENGTERNPVVRKSTKSQFAAEQNSPKSLNSFPSKRYIGAFGVAGWATRSGSSLLKHGEKVKIERAKNQALATKLAKANRGPTAKKQDVVVRFTNSRNEEVGRLENESAAWISTLIDQKICVFEGHVVYAPDHVRSNDTIYLQLRCFMLKNAFEAGSLLKPLENNRQTGLYEVKETQDERDLRLRQVALVKLFGETNLQPNKSNEAHERQMRKGILQAADRAEEAEEKRKNTGAPSAQNKSGSQSEDEEGEELQQDQLDSLYKKAQSFDFDTPEREPSPTFAMSLRKYQKQALHWMIGKETKEDARQEISMHPLWEEYSWPKQDVDEKDLLAVEGFDFFYVNPFAGEISLEFPRQEQNCLGGVLADEMGLGKTIEMLSLIHTHTSEYGLQPTTDGESTISSLVRLPITASGVQWAPCTTLVVAPMSLLAQWQSEAEKASKDGSLKVMMYYGAEKNVNLRSLCCEQNHRSAPNVIVTSYGVVLSEFNQVAALGGARGSGDGLFSLEYFRIILDEAHHIKNRQSKTAKACYELNARHRWVLTGTPIVNRLEDLFSLVRFLRVEPWSNFSYWKTFITTPFEAGEFIRALDVVQTVLEPLVLRRTKDMKTPDGQALVPLPPRTINVDKVELSQNEREVYNHIFARAKRTFSENVAAGTVMKSYTTIFAQILRLRQSCCHPILTRNKDIVAEEEEAAAAADAANGLADDMDLQSLIARFEADSEDQVASAFGAHVLKQIQDDSDQECPICSEEPMNEQAVTGCWHSACKQCLLDYIEHQQNKGETPRCFNCREFINPKDIFEVVRHDVTDDDSIPRISLRRIGSNSSAKVAHLLSQLKRLKREDPLLKIVVFSQFTSFLDLLQPALERDHIHYFRFDGSMAQKQRAIVLSDFEKRTKGAVLLLSLRAGGVGLNLTCARHVFMMDPWWSWAVEAQAIDRVHRMGQEHAVTVHRLIVAESIEEKMLRIQERKKFIATSLGMMSDEEKKMQRIEDIKELLS